MKASTLLTALVCSVTLMAGSAMAEPGQGPGKGGFRMLEGLELTESQKEQLQQLQQAHKADAMATRESRQQNRELHQEQMRALLMNPSFDAEAAKALIQAKQEKHQAAAVRKLQHKHAVMQILTPEQQEQFLAREGKMDKKWQRDSKSCSQDQKGKKGSRGQ